jgi:predicted RNA-binding Zn ribbon-like protein
MTELPAWELDIHFLPGRLCLDLVATDGERWRRRFERMRTPEDMGRWYVQAGLLTQPPPVTREELEAARRLREAIDRAARGLAEGREPSSGDVALINRAAAPPDLVPQLQAGGRRSWGGTVTATAALSTVARDAVDLLSGPLRARIRECARPDCALLFVDTSRPGQRRWCSMAGCGNRTKTAAYRRRQAGGVQP